jgi:hypothetical protein
MAVIAAEAWAVRVARYFDYLAAEFGMAVIASDDSTNWETSVAYGRDPSALVVRYSVEFRRAEVELVQLVAGTLPSVPIFVHPDTPITRALLDDLLLLRAPDEVERLKKLGGLDDMTIDRALEFQARALRLYGSDFLNGDTSVFNDFDRLMKSRVARSPQRLTLHFPEGTSAEEVRGGVERAHQVDSGVPVQVQFYRRPDAPPGAAGHPHRLSD